MGWQARLGRVSCSTVRPKLCRCSSLGRQRLEHPGWQGNASPGKPCAGNDGAWAATAYKGGWEQASSGQDNCTRWQAPYKGRDNEEDLPSWPASSSGEVPGGAGANRRSYESQPWSEATGARGWDEGRWGGPRSHATQEERVGVPGTRSTEGQRQREMLHETAPTPQHAELTPPTCRVNSQSCRPGPWQRLRRWGAERPSRWTPATSAGADARRNA